MIMPSRAAMSHSQPSASTCLHCDTRAKAFCRAVADESIEALAAITTTVDLREHTALFYEGDDARHAFTVKSGMIKLFKLLSDGRRQVTGFLLPGDFLGLAFGGHYVYSAEAVVASRLCRFERGRLDTLMSVRPAIEKELLGRATHELAVAQDQMVLLGRKNAIERLASFLVALARRSGRGAPGELRLPLPMGRADIADYLGLTVETVSRSFTALRKAGRIELPSSGVVLLYRLDELEAMAAA